MTVKGPGSPSTVEEAAEAARRQVLEAESERLAIAAHDVKNGLNVVSLAAHQLAALRVDAEEAAKLKRISEMLLRASRRVSDTVRDLVDLSRMEVGAMKVDRRPFLLRSALEEPLEREDPLAQERGVRFDVDLGEPVTLLGDAERTRAALGVLLSNAVRFSPDRGVVRVRAQTVGARVEVSVEDQGPGIEGSRREEIFRRPTPRRGDPRSLGRGLPLAKGVVEAQGGELRLDSTPGKGSTFTLFLPRFEPTPGK